MPKCNECGTKYSLWSGRDDGLCKDCRPKVELRESEKKKLVLEESKKILELIVQSTGSDPVLSYTFVNWDIVEIKGKTKRDLLGMVAGVAMGGAFGEMIFGGSLIGQKSCTYLGTLGIMTLTQNKVTIGHLQAPFPSSGGGITSEHLGLFKERLGAKQVFFETFDIRTTMFSGSSSDGAGMILDNGKKKLCLQKSDLYINDSLYELPSLPDIQVRATQLGSLLDSSDFTAKLLKGEAPIEESQFLKVKDNKKYLGDLYLAIVNNWERVRLVKNFFLLPVPLKDEMEARIVAEGITIVSLRKKMAIFIRIAVVGTILSFFLGGFLKFLCVVSTVIAIIAVIKSAISWRRAMWCRAVGTKE